MLMDRIKQFEPILNHEKESKVLIRQTKLKQWFIKRLNKVTKGLQNYLIETNQEYKIFHYKGESYNLFDRAIRETTGLVIVKDNTELSKNFDIYINCIKDINKVSDILSILLNYCITENELKYILNEDIETYIIHQQRKEALNRVQIEYEQSLKFIKKIRLLNMIS